MSKQPIEQLSPAEALEQAIKASRLLLEEIGKMADADAENADKTEKLASIREQLVKQVFSQPWSESEVAQQLASLQELDELNEKLQSLTAEMRDTLHKLRADNQHNRKAVNAYGQAKGQFSR